MCIGNFHCLTKNPNKQSCNKSVFFIFFFLLFFFFFFLAVERKNVLCVEICCHIEKSKEMNNRIFIFVRLRFLVLLDENNVKLKNRTLLELKPQSGRRQSFAVVN